MNVEARRFAAREGSGLRGIVLRALADLVPESSDLSLDLRAEGTALLGERPSFLSLAVASPAAGDAALVAAAQRLGLGTEDLVAFALAEAAEAHALVPAALRAIQGAAFGPWPSLGLLERVLDLLAVTREPSGVAAARAFDLGLLEPQGPRVPLPELCFALSDVARLARGLLPGGRELPHPVASAKLPESWRVAAAELAAQIRDRPLALILRRGEQADRLGFASLLGEALDRRAMHLPARTLPGIGAASDLAGWLPVECLATSAGQGGGAVDLAPYASPRVVVAGSGGRLEVAGFECVDLPLPEVSPAERGTLWRAAIPGEPLPDSLPLHRFGPSRIAGIGARARLDRGPLAPRLRRAMGAELRIDLEPHAVLVAADVDDDDLAAEDALRRDLDLLLARCRLRHRLSRAAGPSRMPGVRALLSGPSGTGKTYACSWLATQLDLPLFKLDLASVVSKYIGETEENLARLLDQAEAADSVLLMDEADSLFGARVQAKDSVDRFANSQTNFLLSRIETFDGIVLLTTNGRERIDGAFSRRLDQVIEVPLPAPKERRRIWRLNLAAGHGLRGGEINRLAALIDLAGGHIRNIAQTAEVLAAAADRPLSMADVAVGVDQEYRKIGRSPPSGLNIGRTSRSASR